MHLINQLTGPRDPHQKGGGHCHGLKMYTFHVLFTCTWNKPVCCFCFPANLRTIIGMEYTAERKSHAEYYTEKATEARHSPERKYNACDNHTKHCRPNETKPNSNATHPRKRHSNPTNSQPQAASSQRTHIARTQGCGRVHPDYRRVTTQYLHTLPENTIPLLVFN